MITLETMRDWIACAKNLSNEEISELITEFHKIQNNRADEKRRAAAQKVIEAIDEYLKLGEEISVCGAVYNEDWGGDEDIEATFDVCDNRDGYLTFNFIR